MFATPPKTSGQKLVEILTEKVTESDKVIKSDQK
jgi:hypothetical protein